MELKPGCRVGIDMGGTKIAGVMLGADDEILSEFRAPTPRDHYEQTVETIAIVIAEVERMAGASGTVGIGMPGSLSPVSGLVQNSNSVWLNQKPLAQDAERVIGRPLRFSNDANCFALSEAVDGAAAGARGVFGVILGTGCGGGLVFNGQIVEGPNRCGGEWGHTPLPWPSEDEFPGPTCWCGRPGCMELWLSGTGLALDHLNRTGENLPAIEVARKAPTDAAARATLDRHVSRLARGLSMMTNIFDPDMIVLGGGLSQMPHLYEEVPPLMEKWVFADEPKVRIVPPRYGDASGVRGAARLWEKT
ncbi:ROK family protein [Lutibaculum baratangense]|uniref:ROK family Glucokinase with ambiguous substrate specificity n=1 Tax=Lutibaculum baratangense AMV1 TaxID=631454 RepID=V4RDX8_9HYPH|nr:ROK family protein [Lutibaculum baratangense]ESR23589.1 ROK family Glucokinase with ambiguous substrate specificity [Lutibaculum baratangense AMV1]